MKYYLIKESDYETNPKKILYKPIIEVDDWTRSKEIMMFDEINNECWYSFIFQPDTYLSKVKQENIQEQLSFVSDDPTLESFHEVDKDIFLKVFKNMIKLKKGDDKEILKNIFEEIKNIIDERESMTIELEI